MRGAPSATTTLALSVDSSLAPSWPLLRGTLDSRLRGLQIVLSDKQSVTLSSVQCVAADDGRWTSGRAGAGGWHTRPHGFVFVAACRDRSSYRAELRPRLAAYMRGLSAHDKFIVVVVPHGPTSASEGDLERWAFDQLCDALRNEARASVRLLASGALTPAAVSSASDAELARCEAQWTAVVDSVGDLIVATFYQRTKQYRLRLNELLAQLREPQGLDDFWRFFEAQESFAFLFQRFQQHTPALMLYEEIERQWVELAARALAARTDVRGITRNKAPVLRGAFARRMFAHIPVDVAERTSLAARFRDTSSTVSAAEFAEYLLARQVSFIYRYILRDSCSQFDSLPLTSLTTVGQCALLLQIGGVSSSILALRRILRAAGEIEARWKGLAANGCAPSSCHHARLHTLFAEIVEAVGPLCSAAWQRRVAWQNEQRVAQRASQRVSQRATARAAARAAAGGAAGGGVPATRSPSSSGGASASRARSSSARRKKRGKVTSALSDVEVAAEKAKVLAALLCRAADLSVWHLEALAAAMKEDGDAALRWRSVRSSFLCCSFLLFALFFCLLIVFFCLLSITGLSSGSRGGPRSGAATSAIGSRIWTSCSARARRGARALRRSRPRRCDALPPLPAAGRAALPPCSLDRSRPALRFHRAPTTTLRAAFGRPCCESSKRACCRKRNAIRSCESISTFRCAISKRAAKEAPARPPATPSSAEVSVLFLPLYFTRIMLTI